jgi:hypothetical protein
MLTGTGTAATRTASVGPSPLGFGNWANGTSSNPMFVTVTNTGNVQLTGGTFTIPAGRFTRSGGTCGSTLNVGANCTVGVVFAPNAVTNFTSTLTVAYTVATVAPTPVSLTGTGVANRGAVSIAPLIITLPSGTITGTGLATLTNTSASGGSSVAVSGVSVSGGSFFTYFFNVGSLAGPDNCTGTNLAPGASCTVTFRFSNVLSPRGANRAGTISFTDTATGSPQSGPITGHAN